jgi:hypothetical protein
MYEIDSKLPFFLRNSIKTFLTGKKESEQNGGYSRLDMDYADLQNSIDTCECDNLISADEARKLRKLYLKG